MVIVLLAVPILIQVYLNAGLAYWLSRRLGVAWCIAGPAALIGASNFFELAVAAAISLFGLNSGAALATVVGVLVEVPVMLSVVHLVKASRGWYEAGSGEGAVKKEVQAVTVTIYHNPDCGTLAQHPGDDPPKRRTAGGDRISEASTRQGAAVELISAMGISAPRAVAREGHALCRTRARRSQMERRGIDRLHAGASDPDQPSHRRDAEGHPGCAVPSEAVVDLLDHPVDNFVKEDGEVVATEAVGEAGAQPCGCAVTCGGTLTASWASATPRRTTIRQWRTGRRDRPHRICGGVTDHPHKAPDRSGDTGFFFSFFFHPAMLELCRDQVKVESGNDG